MATPSKSGSGLKYTTKATYTIPGQDYPPGYLTNSVLMGNPLSYSYPVIYSALPTILFNSANIQNTVLQQQFTMMREGSPDNQASLSSPVVEGQGDGNGKSVIVSDKKVIAPVLTDAPKWDTFAVGNGMWSQAQSVNNVPAYNTYAGGLQVGGSYQVAKNFNAGPYVGYQGTRIAYKDYGGSTATDNSVRYGIFGSYRQLGNKGLYIDGLAGGAFNSVAVNRSAVTLNGTQASTANANGNVSGGEFDSLLGTGYNFHAGNFTFGPSSSLQYTYVNLGGTQENGAGAADFNVGPQNASSLLYTLGGQVSTEIQLPCGITLQPYGSLSWQHEFLQNGYTFNASNQGENFAYNTSNPGRDQYIAGIGGNLVFTKNISAYAVCNLINGDSGVFSQAISAGVNFKF
jgi:outer membrane autotransporter protein